MKEKKLLFSLTKKDFVVQTFCTGGPGGQHKNAKQNGMRIIHPASGARAEHTVSRDQAKNKKGAFLKLVETSVFKKWHKAEVARRLHSEGVKHFNGALLEAAVEQSMRPENLKIEETQ